VFEDCAKEKKDTKKNANKKAGKRINIFFFFSSKDMGRYIKPLPYYLIKNILLPTGLLTLFPHLTPPVRGCTPNRSVLSL
jgi:hypothetical protein